MKHKKAYQDYSYRCLAVKAIAYSMISVCISADKMPVEAGNEIRCIKKLKQMISEAPENGFSIEDMAERIGISPYQMIRQFKAACGLTLHQFLKQCRGSKAQRLLEDGKSVAEAVNLYQKALNGGCPLYMIYSQYK